MSNQSMKTHIAKKSKWTIYGLTFITYALYHAVRAAWAGMKNMLNDSPFYFSIDFLGFLDMIVLFIMALSLTIFGHRIQKFGAKRCLLIGMTLLTVLTFLMSMFVLKTVTSKILYVIFFGFCIGIISATGWPSCLYLLSQYFDKKNNTALPIWNGCVQAGDFIALFISDIIIQGVQANPSVILIVIAILLLILTVVNFIFLPQDKKSQQFGSDYMGSHQLNEQLSVNKHKKHKRKSHKINHLTNKPLEQIQSNKRQQQNANKMIQDKIIIKDEIILMQEQKQVQLQIKTQQAEDKHLPKNHNSQSFNAQNQLPLVVTNQEIITVNDNLSQNSSNKQYMASNKQSLQQKIPQASLQTHENDIDTRPVDFYNVWCLPNVAMYVVSYSVIKSVNTLIMTWLVFYLSLPQMDMKDQSRVIAILWAVGVFGGGVIGGKVNGQYSKKKFIIFLLISASMFLTLQKMQQKLYQMQIALAIVICSLSYGIPYNMFSTAIPIMLGQRQQIKNRPGAKSAIISLMEGFGIGVASLSILMIPLIGVDRIHLVLMIYCLIAAAIIGFSVYTDSSPLKCVQSSSQSQREQNNVGAQC